MATLYHFPTFHSLSSHKLLFSSHLPSQYPHIHCNNHSGIFASSLKKKPPPRKSRKVKSDEELCGDIREFISAVGLPENHVPSMKELSQNGRQDLANIVRRRGYKLIRQLLQTSTMGNIDTCQMTEKLEGLSGSEGQNENLIFSVEDVLTSETIQGDANGCTETDEQLNLESTTLSLQEKVAKFIQHGELDIVEDPGFEVKYDRHADESERKAASNDAQEPYFTLSNRLQKDLLSSGSSNAETLNGNVPSSVQKVEHPVLENSSSGNNYISTGEQVTHDNDQDLDVENKQNAENQAEIKRLKFMLHQKELELTQLKQQLEKEKLALSILQTKVETEINKAQRLISDKDAELRATEESLSGLKEVEIQYSGDGENVELAGSFNGWHHKIKMDLLSSYITDLTGSRTSRLWRAVLWLYPGVYEIKFVVDGHWRIDPQRESVNRHSMHNNILRVDQ